MLGVQFIRDIVNGVAYLHGEVPGVNPNSGNFYFAARLEFSA